MARPRIYTRHSQDWDPADSLTLVFCRAMGQPFSEAARALGKSRSAAAAAHWRRINLKYPEKGTSS